MLKNIFSHVIWILNPQKARNLSKNEKSNIKTIGYLDAFFSKYLEFAKTNEEIIKLHEKVDKQIKSNNKIANALIELRKIRLELNKKYNKEEQLVKTVKNFGISKGTVKGKVLNIYSVKQIIPKNCIGIFPTSGTKYTVQFLFF